MKKPHTHFQPGKRLLVIPREGAPFIDRFVNRNDRYLVLAEHGRLPVTAIRAVTVPKGTHRAPVRD